MRLLLSLGALAILTLVFCREHVSDEQEWNMFQSKFNRHYDTNEEYELRKKIFMNNWHEIKTHERLYEEGKSAYWMEVNNFTDWTKDEIAKLKGIGSSHHGNNEKNS